MLRTLLGLRADAPHGCLYVKPTLPPWLPDIAIQHLRVGGCLLDLRFWRDGKGTSRWKVLEVQAGRREDIIQVLDDPIEGYEGVY
jgi:hypothetical protein